MAPKSVKWGPLPYQLRAAEHLVERSYSGLFLKPGMRKTSIMLAAFKALRAMKMLNAILVLAPLRVCYTSWPQEIRKWTDFADLSIGILHGPGKNEVLRAKHDVYVINYEGLKWLFNEALPRLKKWPFDGLVMDESTKLKHTNTERFRILRPHLRKFRRRYILTGTPTANGIMDLFGQCYAMDQGESLGPYITHFRHQYFYSTGYGGYTWLPKPDAEERIHAILAPRVFYAHDEDYLDLPPLLEKNVEIELPPKAERIYRQMENALRLDFEAGKVTAVNSGVASMKCRQIANGGVYLDSTEREWQQIHDAKTDAVEDLVEELSGQPALITYDFLHDLARLKARLGADTPHIGKGGIPPKALPQLIERWNRGEVPYIIVSAQSMAHGVDGLQEAGRAVIWHSLTYNYEDYEQLIRRLRRSGQRERVLVAHIVAKGTIDHALLASVRRKEKGERSFFYALKEYWNGQT